MKAMNRLNDLIERANRKLKTITEEGYPVQFEDVKFSADEFDGVMTVESGTEVIAEGNFDECKTAVWTKVDSVRKEVEAMTGFTAESTPVPDTVPNFSRGFKRDDRQKREWLSDFDFLVKRVSEVAEMANNRLREIVGCGYPFSFDEVKVSVSTDTAGMYVSSGNTPLVSIPRSSTDSFHVVKEKVWSMVDAVRSTVERRMAQKADADALAEEDGKMSAAAAALKAAGIDTAVLGGGVNAEAAKAVAESAKKAVRAANRGVYLYFSDVCDALYGGRRGSLLSVKGYAGGIVVLAGGKPCLVTRFPKVANNATIERTMLYIESDIKAISESRRRYFRTVQSEMEKAALMREKAAVIDAANEAVAAAM